MRFFGLSADPEQRDPPGRQCNRVAKRQRARADVAPQVVNRARRADANVAPADRQPDRQIAPVKDANRSRAVTERLRPHFDRTLAPRPDRFAPQRILPNGSDLGVSRCLGAVPVQRRQTLPRTDLVFRFRPPSIALGRKRADGQQDEKRLQRTTLPFAVMRFRLPSIRCT